LVIHRSEFNCAQIFYHPAGGGTGLLFPSNPSKNVCNLLRYTQRYIYLMLQSISEQYSRT
jgi:hypothetical protein